MRPLFSSRALVRIAFVTCWLGSSTAALGDNFFTDFEGSPDVQPAPGPFTEFDGELSVEFAGGTRFTAGEADLYINGSLKSWMIDPQGFNNGGLGTATLSEGATRVAFFARLQTDAVEASYRVFDEVGGVIEQGDLTEFNRWQEIEVTPGVGQLISSVEISNTTLPAAMDRMVAIEDFSFSTDAGSLGAPSNDDDSGGSALGPPAFLLLALAALRTRVRRRRLTGV